MFKHFLIPTDGSPLSFAALEKGLAFAKEVEAKVTIVTVVVPFPFFSADVAPSFTVRAEYEAKAREQAMTYLRDAELTARTLGVPWETLQTESEHPYKAIIAVAKERGCDLIAMGSHGRSGLAGLVLGSETVKVLTHSTIPVLVYK
jgi:nucleotide-binding universal stress UspA family protein